MAKDDESKQIHSIKLKTPMGLLADKQSQSLTAKTHVKIIFN